MQAKRHHPTGFSKAFDTIPNQRVLLKLQQYSVQVSINRWIQAWLFNREQTVVVELRKINPSAGYVRCSTGNCAWPLEVLVYINDIGANINSQIRLFCSRYAPIWDCDQQGRHRYLAARSRQLSHLLQIMANVFQL